MKRLLPIFLIFIFVMQIFLFGACVQTPSEQPGGETLPGTQPGETDQETRPTTFQVTYIAGTGGKINGQAVQTVERGKDAESVNAIPDDGYYFDKWSDGLIYTSRQDRDVQSNITLTATFVKISEMDPQRKTVNLDYKFGVVENPVERVTFVRDKIGEIKVQVPTREHFTFGGWYLGEMQVTDEQGRIIVGNEILESDETVLYADWTANETFNYKVLIVYVTRVQARLQNYEYQWVDVDYTMNEEQKRFCHATTPYLKMFLDEMLDGMVEFQVDEYFTTEPLTADCFHTTSGNYEGHRGLGLWAYDIPELAQSNLLAEYGSVIVTFGLQTDGIGADQFNDGVAGTAYSKYAQIMFDRCWNSMRKNGVTYVSGAQTMENFARSDTDYNAYIIEHYWIQTFIHELAHTIVMRVEDDTLDDIMYRSDTMITWGNVLLVLKAFYFHEAPLWGEKVGIPYDLWAGNIAKITISNTTNDGSNCYTRIAGHPMTYNVLTGKRDYTEAVIGDEITATLSVNLGYKLLNWSDGVTTTTRTDTVTGDMTLTAILELAEYTVMVYPSEGGTIGGYYDFYDEEGHNQTTYIRNTEFTGVVKLDNGVMSVYATADDGYRFVGWSDGVTENDRYFHFYYNRKFVEWFDDTYTLILIPIFEKIE